MNDSTLLLRQINPGFVQGDRVSSQAFIREPSAEYLKRYRRDAIKFLKTGEVDHHRSFENGFDRINDYIDVLKWHLHQEVEKRSIGHAEPALPHSLNGRELASLKFTPMVTALFPKKEQPIVLKAMEDSVIFLTGSNVRRLIWELSFQSTARTLASIYLTSIGAKEICKDTTGCLGLNVETSCYVSLSYFELSQEDRRFEDYVLHEGAHIFHNTKRKRLGLPSTRSREWLLPIEFSKWELFAYSCEIYGTITARVQESGLNRGHRKAVQDEVEDYIVHGFVPADERVDPDELIKVLRNAAAARTSVAGWKRILRHCST
jgi:hypothetical protein